MPKIESREKTVEQLKEDLRKTREELAIQKWGNEKTLEGMKVLVKEIIQKGKETEEAKAKDEALLQSIGDGVIATDQVGRVIVMNKIAENLLGFTSVEILGKSFIHTVSQEDAQGNKVPDKLRPITLVLNSGKTITNNTYYFVRKDRIKIPVAITVAPVIFDSKTTGVILVFRDITKEKEIDRLKSDFMSLASHQLRTPLTGMEWTAELFAKKEKLTDQGQRYLQDIQFSAHRLNVLVKLLLNASRVESGKVEVKTESIEVVGFIEEFIKKCAILCDKKQLTLSFPKHPAKLTVVTDRNLLEQIIQNILGNALEYTLADGKITVALEAKKDTFIFAARDTGIGIPKKEQARIFERFIRASNAISVKPDGTGLGLYIAFEATKLLGGKVWFESEEGQGSTFYAELPLQTQAKGGENKLIDHPFE